MSRVVCQFSCGAASAVATKLALAQFGEQCVIINAFIAEEHPDNHRFAGDCERWFGHPITCLRDKKYGASVITVFETVGFIKSRDGAACSIRSLIHGCLSSFATSIWVSNRVDSMANLTIGGIPTFYLASV